MLIKMFDEKGRNYFMQKMIRKPLQALKDRVQQLIKGDITNDNLRYILYSAHDV